MRNKSSYVYSTEEIKKAIKDKKLIVENYNDDRIQPSSYEPTIGNEIFIIDSDYIGLFRISKNDTVYENLLRIPARQRERVDITNGFELKKSFSYLIPLKEKVILDDELIIQSSPKSSLGRLFLNTRLIGDYNPSFDELNSFYTSGREISLWLYVQPLAFNIMIHPGLSLNQLRFVKGYNAKVTPSDLLHEIEKKPILYTLDFDGNKISSEHIVSDGLTLHLNLLGSNSHGVVGLRARHNPNPIDLSKKNYYAVEDFFEPIKCQKSFTIKQGEYYLLSSKEILDVPEYLNCELRDHSQVGFIGPLHFAGFIDNGFCGDLVYEIRSDEMAKELELSHNMPISKLDFYWTNTPDKLYGQANNSYQGQIGTKPSKYFKEIDYQYLAREYISLQKEVMIIDRNVLMKTRNIPFGLEKINSKSQLHLFNTFKNSNFQSRFLCEADDLSLQVIIYFVIKNKDGNLLTYHKPSDIQIYPEDRLFNQYSLGIGYHIGEDDFNKSKTVSELVSNVIEKTFNEKGILFDKVNYNAPEIIGTIFNDKTSVDRAHFGIVCLLETLQKTIDTEDFSPIINPEFLPVKKIQKINEQLESWSQTIVEEYFKN